MKIAITYPPLESEKGVPLLGQNRQFQWFHTSAYLYPMLPAYTATLLKNKGFDVVWNDAIAMEWKLEIYLDWWGKQDFDMALIETKTPVVKLHWDLIRELKWRRPEVKIVMAGDHVTAFPEETMKESETDYVLTGGNYDFLMLNLCRYLAGEEEKLEPGIWYRQDGEIHNTGAFLLNHDLNQNPFIDRELTQYQLYSVNNGNFKYTPGTYTMAARDCWHHKCTFCSWTTLYPAYRVRTPESLLDEIGMLTEKYGIREIMDDSGAFPVGEWLHTFCRGMIERGYHKKVKLDCNMRFCALSYEEYCLMKKAGFRLVLFGLESANQKTLDRIAKGERVEEMVESCRLARKAGLYPHITLMFGYPWEREAQIQKTVKLGQQIMKKGWASTLQATIVIPYPGTPLYRQCRERGLLLTEDYEDFDQRKMVMKTPVSEAYLKAAVRDVYRVAFSPRFLFHKITAVRDWEDIRFLFKAVKRVLGHLTDFGSGGGAE